eukprot:1159761-Pelagomonas_calceolata.AAC.10
MLLVAQAQGQLGLCMCPSIPGWKAVGGLVCACAPPASCMALWVDSKEQGRRHPICTIGCSHAGAARSARVPLHPSVWLCGSAG